MDQDLGRDSTTPDGPGPETATHGRAIHQWTDADVKEFDAFVYETLFPDPEVCRLSSISRVVSPGTWDASLRLVR